MRSLTVRIFLSFWLIIGVLIALAGVAGYAYSERLREALENFEISDTVVAASEVLDAGGRDGLERWLRDIPRDSPIEVFVTDRDGNDLLGRRLPRWAEHMMRRYEARRGDWRPRRHQPPNLRPARPLTQLLGPDGDVFTLFVSPRTNPYRQWIGERAGPAFLLLAVVLSGGVSYALARAIARPVRTFREATVSIAEGKLDTRVAASMRNRRDEIGMLAHDLDAMADKLQRSAEQQVELTQNISHELRSPLARLRVALELARRQAGDLPEFSRIDNETERLDELIGQILSFSRLFSPGDESKRRVDLAHLLHDVVEDANYECRTGGAEGVTVRLACNTELPVDAYPAALTSAIENVLRNALRHSPRDGIVDVRADAEDGRIRVLIEDRGSGVPEEALARIFEPFYREPDAMARGSTGTGLGLAIARRAIDRHGGSISAHNSDAGGLRVEIELPAAGYSG